MAIPKPQGMAPWLNKADLKPGERLDVTISKAMIITLKANKYGPEREALKLGFLELEKDWRPNATSVNQLIAFFGEEEENLIGKRITLTRGHEFEQDMPDAIYISATLPEQPKQAVQATKEDNEALAKFAKDDPFEGL